MTIGEIKIAALKLMFANYAEDLAATNEDIGQLMQNENYASYLLNMPESINRAVAFIHAMGKVPPKTFYLEDSMGLRDDYGFDRFNLAALIPDYERFVRLDKEYFGSYITSVPYRIENGNLLLPASRVGLFIVRYQPRLEQYTTATNNETELELDGYLANIIPYYIKGDLYQDDEPNLAIEARATFERMLASYIPMDSVSHSCVEPMYSIE